MNFLFPQTLVIIQQVLESL